MRTWKEICDDSTLQDLLYKTPSKLCPDFPTKFEW
jgi:hypothetical protein